MSRDLIFTAILAVVMVVTFSVGRSYGLKTAPEYIAHEERKDAEMKAFMDGLNAEYENSTDATCEKIFDLVTDHLTYSNAPPDGR